MKGRTKSENCQFSLEKFPQILDYAASPGIRDLVCDLSWAGYNIKLFLFLMKLT